MLSTFPQEKLDPRVKRTRQLLEQAFMEALDEKGFQTVSVQDITDRAGVNRATFYAHFEDKYALLDHTVRQSFRHEIEKRTLDACHYTPQNLLNLIIAVCEFIGNVSAHCSPAQPQFESLVERQIREQIYELLQKWIEQADPQAANPQSAATAATWALYGLAAQWVHEKKRIPVEEYAGQVLPLIASNLQLEEPA
ncbi:MAG TPA: TetR/AcrR family transcriptional regulator [Anaerolineales bacterium]